MVSFDLRPTWFSVVLTKDEGDRPRFLFDNSLDLIKVILIWLFEWRYLALLDFHLFILNNFLIRHIHLYFNLVFKLHGLLIYLILRFKSQIFNRSLLLEDFGNTSKQPLDCFLPLFTILYERFGKLLQLIWRSLMLSGFLSDFLSTLLRHS